MNQPTSNRPPKRPFDRFRGYAGMGMGVFYFFVSFWVVYMQRTGRIEIGTSMSYVLGTLILLYGIFRIYRGFLILRNANRQDGNPLL